MVSCSTSRIDSSPQSTHLYSSSAEIIVEIIIVQNGSISVVLSFYNARSGSGKIICSVTGLRNRVRFLPVQFVIAICYDRQAV